jgi:hypothetical protein
MFGLLDPIAVTGVSSGCCSGEPACVMVRRLRGFAGVRHQLKAIAWPSEANGADITGRLEVHPPQFAQLSDILSPQL